MTLNNQTRAAAAIQELQKVNGSRLLTREELLTRDEMVAIIARHFDESALMVAAKQAERSIEMLIAQLKHVEDLCEIGRQFSPAGLTSDAINLAEQSAAALRAALSVDTPMTTMKLYDHH